MYLSFAPLEGITGWVFRSLHHQMFPGVDRYYTPFYAPTVDSPLSGRGLADMLPEHNAGVPLVPQLLANRADAFLASARLLQDMGYSEVNLNLGCPSGTVGAKGKGAGFLGRPQELDRFLEEVFSRVDLRVSVKTRVGQESPEEWPRLLEIFSCYPIAELIVHSRIRRDFYRGPVRPDCFQYAAEHSALPLCYNGDLNSPADCQAATARFGIERLMLGRGLVANPALARETRGGAPLEQTELKAFHDGLLEAYRSLYSGDRPVLGKMKELWFYMACLFPDPARYLKRMRKARSLTEYAGAAEGLFRDQELVHGGAFSASRAEEL